MGTIPDLCTQPRLLMSSPQLIALPVSLKPPAFPFWRSENAPVIQSLQGAIADSEVLPVSPLTEV